MMQHNESNKPQNWFRRLLKEKGYYIVLTLCLVAVGISGYVFISTAMEQNRAAEQETLSVPLTIDEPESEKPSNDKPSVSQPDKTQTPEEQTPSQEASAEVEEPAEESSVQPVSGEITQSHAMDRLTYNPTTQDWRVHNGVDLAAAEGTAVMAARAGTVTAVYEDEYYGTTVVIRHEDDYTTHYCSLAAETAVSAGDTVEAGQIIGAVGATALLESADGPHLHFEVYCAGAPVDPAEFLP